MMEDDEAAVEYEWNNEEEKREVRGLLSAAPLVVGRKSIAIFVQPPGYTGGLVPLLATFTVN